jgi:hypothetical protein
MIIIIMKNKRFDGYYNIIVLRIHDIYYKTVYRTVYYVFYGAI